jgi:hypothetical protein
MWCNKNRLYDIVVCYYGDADDKDEHVQLLRNCSDLFVRRKGGKFPNFYALWNAGTIDRRYTHYYIVDDDIRMTTAEIDRLFLIADKGGLKLCQPGFDGGAPGGTISHNITIGKLANKGMIRYTNFVEVTAMLFNRDALALCLASYDGSLVGWGIDWLFLNVLQSHKANEKTAKSNGVAIVDDVLCINPFERHCQKTGKPVGKEITRLEVEATRKEKWRLYKEKHKMTEFTHASFDVTPIDVRVTSPNNCPVCLRPLSSFLSSSSSQASSLASSQTSSLEKGSLRQENCCNCGADCYDQCFAFNARSIFFDNFSQVPTMKNDDFDDSFSNCSMIKEVLVKYTRFLSAEHTTDILLTKRNDFVQVKSTSKHIIFVGNVESIRNNPNVIKRYMYPRDSNSVVALILNRYQ